MIFTPLKKIALIYTIAITTSFPIHAGVAAATDHSRANCLGNNESITWWLGHDYIWRSISEHMKAGEYTHYVDTGYNKTWRAAAVHWNESWTDYSYVVSGYHFTQIEYGPYAGQQFMHTETFADDCAIYDGWWDY